jgi:hypothetical protein
MYDYFLELNDNNEIVGVHKCFPFNDGSDEEYTERVVDAISPEHGRTLVRIDADRFLRYTEIDSYVDKNVLSSMSRKNDPIAYWDHDHKHICFYPLLEVDEVRGCERIEGAEGIASIVSDVPVIYRVTDVYPVIKFKPIPICPENEHDTYKKKHGSRLDVDIEDFDVKISTGNTLLLPNRQMMSHITKQPRTKAIAVTIPNPKTNMMLVTITHPRAIMGEYSFFFVWDN